MALAKNDDSGLVRLALASTLQRLPVLSRGNLARALASRVEDQADHNLPMLVWYGITPMVDHDPQGLFEVARATSWPSLRSWIARALTARSKESPQAFNALLDLVSEPSKESDSLLSGIERAVLGMEGFSKPVKWDQVRANLGTHPRVLKLSVIFGDAEARQRMEKLVMNANAAVASRQQVLEILIESDSPNLRTLCMKLLDEPTMKLWAARGLAKFDDLEIGEKLIDGLTGFTTEEQSEVVELLCVGE